MKSIRKKRLLSALLCAAMLGGLVGCGKNTPGMPATDSTVGETDTIGKGNEPIEMRNVKYAPENYAMWDSWTVEKDGRVYLIHLKGLIDGNTYNTDFENKRGYGLAESTDLVHWGERGEILSVRDSDNPNDVDFRYTGSAIVKDGRCYVFYTMRKWGGQRIGVAWSDDMEHWTEYNANPVLTPDPRWFIGFNPTDPGKSTSTVWTDSIDCRDFLVIPDPSGEGYLGYFVASAEGIYQSPCAVIGLAKSKDLLHWEQTGIVYRPSGVSMPEMVDVFQIDGKWYMTLTTGRNNGGTDLFSDPYISRAQVWASADSPEGPFLEDPEDNVFIGGQYDSGYSSRTILFRDQLRVLYTDSNHGKSVLSLPKNVGVNAEGKLRAYYAADLLDQLRQGTLDTSIAAQPYTSFAWKTRGGEWKKTGDRLSCTTDPNSWQAALLGGVSKNLELCFTVSADSTATSFGVALTNATDLNGLDALQKLLVLDRKNNRIYLTDSTWELDNCRRYDFREGTAYEVRVLLMGNTLELYLNGELVFNTGVANLGRNRAGLFANNGSLTADGVSLWKLES